jgi:hypothetical protein
VHEKRTPLITTLFEQLGGHRVHVGIAHAGVLDRVQLSHSEIRAARVDVAVGRSVAKLPANGDRDHLTGKWTYAGAGSQAAGSRVTL